MAGLRLLAASGIITAVGFAAVSALIVCAGLSYGLVAIFVFGAFSFGHNSLVAPSSQFIIDAVVTCVLLVYVFSGWAMRQLVLKSERGKR